MIRPQVSSEASKDASEVNQNTGFKLLEIKEILVLGRGIGLDLKTLQEQRLGSLRPPELPAIPPIGPVNGAAGHLRV